MSANLDEQSRPSASGREEESLSKCWIYFGSALIGYLTVGMTMLVLLPGPSVWLPPVFIGTACLAFALFARFWWGWRGFLAGALVALGSVASLQLLLLWCMRVFWPASG